MPGYLPRLFTVPGDSLDSEGASEAKLTRRTLTNLYNDRSTWLQHGHADLHQAVWAAYGWDDPYPAVVDGESALSLIAQDPPHLVISDVMMPRGDGFSVLWTLRRAGSTVPVLLMSAAPLKQGAVGAPLVHKPFDLDDLLAQVHRLVTKAGPPAGRAAPHRLVRAGSGLSTAVVAAWTRRVGEWLVSTPLPAPGIRSALGVRADGPVAPREVPP